MKPNTTTETGAPAPTSQGRVVSLEELHKRFTYHPPHSDQPQRYVTLREAARTLATTILWNTPASREQSVALTKLEEVCFWANASIARNEPPPHDPELDGLEPHERRVVIECRELDEREQKLAAFINESPTYLELPPAEKERLAVQHDCMVKYKLILRERIAAFK